jgi:hypothetical protein
MGEPKDIYRELAALLEIEDEFMKQHPELSQERLNERGDYIFTAQAIAAKDMKAWSAVQQTQIDRKDQALRREKLDLDRQKYEDEAADEKSAAVPLTPEEKEQRVEQVIASF